MSDASGTVFEAESGQVQASEGAQVADALARLPNASGGIAVLA
jgi:hypothetical protein